MSSLVVLIALWIGFSAGATADEALLNCKAGWGESQHGQYSTAIMLYNDCIKYGNLSKDNLAKTYQNIGIAYRMQGKYKVAIENFNKALSYNTSENYSAYINRGNAWSGLREYDKALDDYAMSLFLKPNNGAAIFNRGIVYERLGDFDAAALDFIEAAKLKYSALELVLALNRHKERIKRLTPHR